MTDVAGDEHLVVDLPSYDMLAVGQLAVREAGVDADLVYVLGISRSTSSRRQKPQSSA